MLHTSFAKLLTGCSVLHRLFPFSRGLFESKVSNLWHAIDVVFKIRQWAPREILVKLRYVAHENYG